MPPEPTSELAQYRVTLFVGPQSVEGKPSTQHCVFNVKKRSWKGGVQVAVEVSQRQIDEFGETIRVTAWLDRVLQGMEEEARAAYAERARELFVQALCRCRLELVLQSGISQENQCLSSDTVLDAFRNTVLNNTDRVTSFIAAELDLAQGNCSNLTG